MTVEHQLKTWVEFLRDIAAGIKTFELRKDDRSRPYQVGDVLLLQGFDPCQGCTGIGRVPDNCDFMECPKCRGEKGVYTGEELRVDVTYKLEGGKFGLLRGYVVLGIRLASV